MIINEEGTYTLRYTATDDCGKTTEVERELVVADTSPRRTVLYTDGTFIINEKQKDQAHNIELHGEATNVYIPFDLNGATDQDKYIFRIAGERPWVNQIGLIKSVEIGERIMPTSTSYWFSSCNELVRCDFSNLDTSNVTSVTSMFSYCTKLTTPDVSNFNTSNVIDFGGMFYGCNGLAVLDISNFNTNNAILTGSMFYGCKSLSVLDLSSFDTSNVTNMTSMFEGCRELTKIYVSNKFVVAQVTSSNRMFSNMSTNLVGGAGTVWSSSYVDKTRAQIDGGTSNPGYFTAKS